MSELRRCSKISLTKCVCHMYYTRCSTHERLTSQDPYLICCGLPLHDLSPEVMAVPEALDDDVQEAVVLSSGIAQTHD